jgi:hypothetical protein
VAAGSRIERGVRGGGWGVRQFGALYMGAFVFRVQIDGIYKCDLINEAKQEAVGSKCEKCQKALSTPLLLAGAPIKSKKTAK